MRSSKRYGRGLIRRMKCVTKSSFHNTYKTPLSPPLPKLLLNIHNHSKPITFFIKPNTLFSSSSSSSLLPPSTFTYFHNLTTIADHYNTNNNNIQRCPDGTDEEVEPIDLWEEEDDAEPENGDGADGGGIALQNCLWGERALSMAREVLLELDDDIQLYAFKTSPKGYIYVRLDKLSHEYGCPSMEEIECYSRKYKQRLDDVGASGEIPDDLALEVSSPSAERLLRVPEDLHRFKEMPMRVFYVDELEGKCQGKDGVFLLDVINIDLGTCTWRLANVKENRDPLAKGRPMSRKQRDWRLEIPFTMSKRVTLYLDYC